MHLKIRLLTLALMLTFTATSHAKNPISDCFKKEKSHVAISFCLTIAYKDREEIRETMEQEILAIARYRMHTPKNISQKNRV